MITIIRHGASVVVSPQLKVGKEFKMPVSKFALSAVASVALVASSVASTAYAAKVEPTKSLNSCSAQILSVTGEVVHSGADGYVNVSKGMQLPCGSELTVGEGSSAKIRVGGLCNVDLAANSSLLVSAPSLKQDGSCADVAQFDWTSEAPQTTYGQAVVGAGAGAGAGGAGAGAAAGAGAGAAGAGAGAGLGGLAGGLGGLAGGLGGLGVAGAVGIGAAVVGGTIAVTQAVNGEENSSN